MKTNTTADWTRLWELIEDIRHGMFTAPSRSW